MNTRGGQVSRGQKSRSFQGEGLNWILIAGGALLSTLSIRLGYKLKQALDAKQQHDSSTRSKGIGSSDRRRSSGCRLHSNMYSFTQEDDWCFNCISGAESIGGKHPPNGHMPPSSEVALPLVTVPTSDFNKDNGIMWASSPDRLELPPKPFHHSNCSDSPRVSESGSDIYSKREVIQKLRQQLKRRDDMILEMQDQITELQNSLNAQISHSSHLQSQLDVANRDLFDSEGEIQRLRKVIAGHCVVRVNTNDKTSTVTALAPDIKNGHANGYLGIETNLDSPEKRRGDEERIGMLRNEVEELKEVIEGKQYLLQSYKEQKMELSMKIKELQQRLDFQLPSIL
ncbi:uncharacterized protein LOC105792664 [Gossypium raimondii]|uniref:Uncharacterized protein n=3 Tax=Gossypium raimondii TaxID=29730 RepID=A0A0D2R421_GOSRA|nr:uncharacterized protein LOC105792664 [Gossypium raimondii]XP_012476794.1 uncharacterized protein LOC105792664 [Gossypium raimondii]KJB26684.1 hypothetical protein B456_004G255700 [Gossypium raimondii]KJB26686.1 hypothetical protein B456_004G255700 [Gossypium raimondii]KJB26687.1 hypothetical protein B456_004G255700 [Gossypium raimondii]KJB26689.1 hypothetical protein B456_004G255700 [Gossypium raimondii]KJB26692.1 hypothetical protein B456_004G255700 [Gossypium raimondii]